MGWTCHVTTFQTWLPGHRVGDGPEAAGAPTGGTETLPPEPQALSPEPTRCSWPQPRSRCADSFEDTRPRPLLHQDSWAPGRGVPEQECQRTDPRAGSLSSGVACGPVAEAVPQAVQCSLGHPMGRPAGPRSPAGKEVTCVPSLSCALPSEHLGLLLVSRDRPVFHPQDRLDVSWPRGSCLLCSHCHELTWDGRQMPSGLCQVTHSEWTPSSPSLGLEGVTLPGRYEPACQAELGPPLLQGSHSRCSIISANGRKCEVSSARARAREGNRNPDGVGMERPPGLGLDRVAGGSLPHPERGRRDGQALPSEPRSAPCWLWAAHFALSRRTRSAC